MSGEIPSPGVLVLDRHTQVRQLEDFATMIRAVAAFFGFLALGATMVWRDAPMFTTALVALGYAGVVWIGLFQLRAQRVQSAVFCIAGGIIVGEILVILLQPALLLTLATISLIPLWIAHQYARQALRRVLLVTSVLGAVVVVVVGRFHVMPSILPDWFLATFQITSALAVMGLCIVPSLQWQSRLRLRIAQQQETQTSLEQETARWKAMLLCQHDAVICTDPKGEVMQMNGAAEKLTGWMLDAVRGRHIEDVFCVETADSQRGADDFIQKVLTSRKGFSELQSVRLAAKSGKVWNVAASAAPITVNGEAIVGVIFTFKDMTERLVAMERLQAIERMQTVERLAAGLARDFDEAVTTIGASSQRVLERLVVGEMPAWEDAASIVRTNERAQQLVRHLLAIGQGRTPKAEMIDVGEFVGATADLLSRSLGPDIFVKGRHEVYVWPIRADAGQLQEALAELAHYARDIMQTGGALLLEGGNEYIDDQLRDYVGPPKSGAYVKIVLRDATNGFEQHELLRALEPYFAPRLHQAQATLKLAVAQGLVRQNGGWLSVNSEMRYGCSFTMYFPRAEPDAWMRDASDDQQQEPDRHPEPQPPAPSPTPHPPARSSDPNSATRL